MCVYIDVHKCSAYSHRRSLMCATALHHAGEKRALFLAYVGKFSQQWCDLNCQRFSERALWCVIRLLPCAHRSVQNFSPRRKQPGGCDFKRIVIFNCGLLISINLVSFRQFSLSSHPVRSVVAASIWGLVQIEKSLNIKISSLFCCEVNWV